MGHGFFNSFSVFSFFAAIVGGQKSTCFHADLGKEFPSQTLWRGPSSNYPSPSSVLCPLLYGTEHLSRGEKGEKVQRKGEEEGWPAKGAKRKKGCVKTGQDMSWLRSNYPHNRQNQKSSHSGHLFHAVGKRGVEFKQGGRHDRTRHNRRNRQNRQNFHGCLFVLYFVGQAKRGARCFPELPKPSKLPKPS